MDTNSTKLMTAGYGVEGLGYRGPSFSGLSDVTGSAGAGTGGAADGAASTQAASQAGASFQNQLQAAQAKKPLTITEARKVAGDLVSNALIMPLLKQIRRDPFGQNTIFSPGTGEKAFGPEFDMQLADRIAHSPKMTVTDALAQRLATRGQPKSQGSAKQTGDRSDKVTKANGVDVHG